MKTLFSILFFVFIIVKIQGQTILNFGSNSASERGIVSHQLPDGTIWVVGTSNMGTLGGIDIAIMKIDTLGNILSPMQYFGSVGDDTPNNMLYQNGQFIVVGEIQDNNGIDGFIFVFDTAGVFGSFNIYGQANQAEQFYSIEPTADGGFVVAGFGETLASVGADFLISKFDDQFHQEWIKIHDFGYNEMGMAALVNPNGGYLMTGDQLQPWGGFNVAVCGLDNKGDVLWDTVIAYPYNGGCKGAAVIGDEVIVFGEIATATSTAFDIYLARIDWQGNTLWQGTIPKTNKGDAAFDLWVKNASTFYLTGYNYIDTISTTDLFVMELDTAGNVVEEKHYPLNGFQMGYDFKPVLGGGYMLTGFNTLPDNQILVVIDNFSTPTTAINHIETNIENALLFPNPTKDIIHIPANLLNYDMEIFDILGRGYDCVKNGAAVDLSKADKGLYVFVFRNKQGKIVMRQKIWKA